MGGGNNHRPGALALPEPLFMSNRGDMEIIRQLEFVERYALSMCRGVYRYAGIDEPAQWGDADAPPEEPTAPVTPWTERVAAARAWLSSVEDWRDQEVRLDRLAVILHELWKERAS